MNRFSAAYALSLAMFAPLTAFATVQRTFVSASGSDAQPCSVTLPCRSFAAAIAQTNAGGEVIVLDSGGYGSVTITKSVSIISPPGVYAGVSGLSAPGVTVNAGSTDSVTLQGLFINYQGAALGVDFASGGALVLDRCTINGKFAKGVYVYGPTTAVVLIKDTHIVEAGIGIQVGGLGGEFVRFTMIDSTMSHVGAGLDVYAGGEITVANSRLIGSSKYSSVGISIGASPVHTPLQAHVGNTLIREFGGGVQASGDAKMTVASSDLSHTSTGATVYGGATVALSGNRLVHGNSDTSIPNGIITTSGTNYQTFNVFPSGPLSGPAGLQ
jgi:hypothetical protein